MLKKILIVLGALFSLVLLAIAGLFLWLWLAQSQYEGAAVPFIQKAVPEIATWDPEILKSYLAPEVLASAPDADLIKLVDFFKKLGALKSMEPPVFVGVFRGVTMEAGAQKIITYTVAAKFEAGDALITIKLQDKDGQLKVNNFNINSKALL